MKKLFYLFLLGGVLLSSCELEDENNNDGGGTGGGGNNNQTEEGLVQSFNVSLNYNSTSLTAASAFDVDDLKTVGASNSAADVCLGWQNNQGYFMSSPNGNLLKECYSFNDITLSNSNTTTVANLGQVSLSNYDEASELKSLSVTSGSIPNLNGKNQVIVNSGDVIAFQKGNVKGVGQVTGLSKVTKKITFKGYVYNPSSAK
ncbi:MAG: hypothetical protein II956_07620 [Bacteroidales bacterium]|nr:hypothetical protein [Bacteroidales bacterium]